MIFEKLVDIIKKAQNHYPSFSNRMLEAEALGRWKIAVGDTIAKHSRAVKVKDSILWVEVEHPIWRSELHYRKKQILDILNAKTPCPRSGLGEPKDILTDIFYIDPNPKKSRFFKK
ncbi:MAG: DUF721 domain-containing protein [Bdellovibrionia bacterium]